MQPLNIGIIGTRGIPNHYGGFEQVAQYLAVGLLSKGHQVTVYNSHNHPYKKNEFEGVQIINCFDAEKFIGTAGQFVYDFNCIRNARRQHFDVILFLGYTSSSVWGSLFPKKAIIISNMDGMEWKRTKYLKPVRFFLKYAERLAVKYSHYLIADSTVIQTYLKQKYNTESKYIPYGAETAGAINETVLEDFGLSKSGYFMLMARMERENNIEIILKGFCNSNSTNKFLVIGNYENSFGRMMYKKYGADTRVHFAGAIFDEVKTTTLRAFCRLYFHGHSVGGTNPSLLQAMANGAVIAAHGNPFNKAVLQNNALYFNTPADVLHIINTHVASDGITEMTKNNIKKIEEQFNWPGIIRSYEEFIADCCKKEDK